MSNFWRILRKLLGQPDFVLAFAILGVSAIGLNVCTDYLKLHYRKQAVPLRVFGREIYWVPDPREIRYIR